MIILYYAKSFDELKTKKATKIKLFNQTQRVISTK